ncbi:SLOG family protein [Leucobacter sp. cx-169]|uniref:SLOG family protein n=1 Tax=Leucobacter sp. cx-169 TaxID=2770549 RepID=UPI001CB74F7A
MIVDYSWIVEGIQVVFHDRNFFEQRSVRDGQLATVQVGHRKDQGVVVTFDDLPFQYWVHPSECEPVGDWRSRRLLVTGSRALTDIASVRSGLDEAVAALGHGLPVTLISGGCPTGADRIAEDYWAEKAWPVERYPAQVSQYGKRAFYLRNAFMARLGAGVCAAFPLGRSAGTRMTMNLASSAGIPVLERNQ